jgi:diguanylate cyclase (GGDEF)-like protein
MTMRRKRDRRSPQKKYTLRSLLQRAVQLCANIPAGLLVVALTLTYTAAAFPYLQTAAPPISYLSLLLFAAQWALLYYQETDAARSQNAYLLITTLIPLNILFFAAREERGVLSLWGKQNAVLLAGQAAFVGSMLVPGEDPLLALLKKPFLPFDLPTPLSDLAVVFFAAAAVILLARRNFSGKHLPTPFFGALIAAMLAHHYIAQPIALPLFYTAAATMLSLSVMQASYSMAYLDELTGLPSRRALNEDLLKLNGVYTIAMLDIDHFKSFNDTYGHDAGDDVLRFIGALLRTVSGGGKIYRYGGEEFTVLFPGKPLKEAAPHLELIRSAVAEREFVLRTDGKRTQTGKKLTITVSIGAAEPRRRYMKSEDVLREADAALYRAKEKGRNCVSI